MRLRVTHNTTFTYDHPVIEAYMEMRLRPLDAGGQRCESFRIGTNPAGEVLGYVDRFGNTVRHFDTIAPTTVWSSPPPARSRPRSGSPTPRASCRRWTGTTTSSRRLVRPPAPRSPRWRAAAWWRATARRPPSR